MSDVNIHIGVDDTEAIAKLDAVMAKADEATKKAKQARKAVMTEVRIAVNALSGMMANFSQAMSLIGAQVDAFYGALIGMTLSSVSMLLSISAALAETVVGIPWAAVVMTIAVGLNIAAIGKLLNDKLHNEGVWKDIAVSAYQATQRFQQRTPMGGSF